VTTSSIKKFIYLISILVLVLAGLIFWLWPETTMYDTSIEIPVTLESLPVDLIPTGPPVKGLTVSVRGSRAALANLTALKPVYVLDLHDAEPGKQSIPIHAEQLRLPNDITVLSIDLSAIHLVLEKALQKEVPVIVDLTGNPAKGFSVTAATVTPPTVMLRGPGSVLGPLSKILTKPIDVSGVMESFKKEIAVTLVDGIEMLFPKGVITAEIKVEEKVVTRAFENIPVQGKNASYRFSVTPPVIRIDVKGPVNVLDRLLDSDDFDIYVDLAGLKPGVYVRRTTIALPLNTTLVGVNPEIFTVNVIKP
jgi:YbbR domain-containing protein